jgi:hypothetical protein
MKKVTIKAKYPCKLHKEVRLPFICDLIPIQKFERKCPVCGFEWTIRAIQLKHINDVLIVKLEWSQNV